MTMHSDWAADLDEKSTERMSFRAKPRIKQIIQRAAALSGVDDSVFTLSAAYQSALETIAAHERTILDARDHDAFFAALDAPPSPSEALKHAVARHQATIESK